LWQVVVKKRTLVFLGIAFLLITWGIFLASNSDRSKEITPEWLARGIIRPIQQALNGVSGLAVETWSSLTHLGVLQRENEELKDELDAVQMENKRLRLLAQENQRLRLLLDFKEHVALELLPAEVIAQAPNHWSKTVIIDKGRRDGLKKNMAVITPDGLAGRILSLRQNSAEVLLLSDGRDGNSLSGVLERTRELVFVYGAGDYCRVVPSDIGVTIKTGDRILTSESSLYFPKDLLVGIVVDVKKTGTGLKGEALMKPMVKFSRMEEVFVVKKPIFRQPKWRNY
jgi:rod shape-determining protein MreC